MQVRQESAEIVDDEMLNLKFPDTVPSVQTIKVPEIERTAAVLA